MSDVIDITEKLLDKEGELYYKDHYGDIWYPYSYGIELGGRKFCFKIWARSDDEAQNDIIKALKDVKYLGKIVHEW